MVLFIELCLLTIGFLLFFVVCSKKMELVICIATFTLIFQQAFTVKLFGATLRISDVLFVLIAFVIFLNMGFKKDNLYNNKLKIEKTYLYYCVFIFISTIIMTLLLKDKLKLGTIGMEMSQFKQTVSSLFTPCVAFATYLVGAKISNGYKKINIQRILNVLCNTNVFLSIYSILQFFSVNIMGKWVHIPGETLNEGTTFAYGIRRSWGFFIEPGALGVFLVFNILLIYLLYNRNRKKKFIVICLDVCAVLCSFSSIALVSLILFLILLVLTNNVAGISKTTKILILAVVATFILMVFVNPALNEAIITKIFKGDSYSMKDRSGNIEILKRMFENYPVAGVGFGNFGGLRNLYATGTLVEYKNFYDMPSVLYFEVIGEQGIVGGIFFLAIIKKMYFKIKSLNFPPLAILIPLLAVFTTSSHFIYNYLAFGIGIILNCNIKNKHEK